MKDYTKPVIEISCWSWFIFVCISIKFLNTSDDKINFQFSNKQRKAEWLGLKITDQKGNAVKYINEPNTSNIKKDLNTISLNPNDFYVYKLWGLRIKNKLSFKGAKYKLENNTNYKIKFSYSDVLSNEVSIF